MITSISTSILRRSSAKPKQCAQRVALATILILAAFVFGWGATARAEEHNDGDVRIMTQNLFQGTNFTEILAARSPMEFLIAVATTRQNILATKPAERAAAIAREIARERPHLVALQEAAILRSALVPVAPPPALPVPVTSVEVDQLGLVLAELDRLGLPYHVLAILPNIDAQAPSFPSFVSVRLTARMAILARSDLGSDDIRLSNVQQQASLVNTSITTPFGASITDPRGWASVDVKVDGREFRFVTTHLDQSLPINRLQAGEAIQSAVNSTELPVVFVGDFNNRANVPSDPSFANYQALLNAGLVDAWQQKHPYDPGLNCCQNPSLANVTSDFTLRVDLVLLRGGIEVRDIHVVGGSPSDRVDGLWPSDHGGLVATLRIPKESHQ
jgi:endonuclease/exonuclease/phosphatase family metal-dependent hydrolase